MRQVSRDNDVSNHTIWRRSEKFLPSQISILNAYLECPLKVVSNV